MDTQRRIFVIDVLDDQNYTLSEIMSKSVL